MTATITPIPTAPADAADAPIRRHQAHDRAEEESARELEEQICGLAAHIARFTCEFLELLGAFDQAQGWQHRGFVSASHWLSWRCGMTATTAREHLRVARALAGLPLITADFRAGELSYSKVRALTRVATAETEADLLNIARNASASQLDRFISGLRQAGAIEDVQAAHQQRRVTWRIAHDGQVHLSARLTPEDGAVVIEALQATRDYLRHTGPEDPEEPAEEHTFADALVQICADGPPPNTLEPSHGSRRSETVVHTTLEQLAQAGSGPPGAGGPRPQPGPAPHPATAPRLTCDTGIVLHIRDEDTYTVVPSTHPGRTIDVGERTRTPNAALMRALWDRDQGCRYPACGRRRYIHAHHVIHWARGGPTTLDNL